MKSRKMNKWIVSLLTLVLLCSFSVPVLAADLNDIDWTKKGSITLTLKARSTGEAVPGAQLALIQVAKAEEQNGRLHYAPCEGFEDWSFDNPEDSSLPGKLAAQVNASADIEQTEAKTNTNGEVRFDDNTKGLELGLYLVMQTNVVTGYSTISPFLVMVPTSEDGVWKYDVTGSPKPELDRSRDGSETVQITVKKEWDDADRGSLQRPQNVTVRLMRGTAVVDTVTLQEANSWTKTWSGLASSSQWSVTEVDVPEGYTVSYEKTTRGANYTYTITNSVKKPENPDKPDNPDKPTTPDKPKLPQTGQLNWPVPILAFAGMLFFAAGFVLVFLKREEQDA